jgi:hypothetical protein
VSASEARPACFDATLARHETWTLPIASVTDLLPLTHAPERVEEYRRAMAVGLLFPPVSVLRLFGRFILADGHKRFAACRPIVGDRLVVEVWPFSRFLLDQWEQARANGRKNAAILTNVLTNRPEAVRLLRGTAGHWRRVATSLLTLARGSFRGRAARG